MLQESFLQQVLSSLPLKRGLCLKSCLPQEGRGECFVLQVDSSHLARRQSQLIAFFRGKHPCYSQACLAARKLGLGEFFDLTPLSYKVHFSILFLSPICFKQAIEMLTSGHSPPFKRATSQFSLKETYLPPDSLAGSPPQSNFIIVYE